MLHQLRKTVKFLNFKQFPSKSEKKFVNFDNFIRDYKKSPTSRDSNNSNLELRNFATKSDSSKALITREKGSDNSKAGTSSLRNFASKSDGETPNFDYYRRTAAKTDGSKAKLSSYGILAAMYIGGLYGAKSVVNYFVGSMSASADVLALASIEINLNEIPEGIHRTFKWRGKPLFIWHRTPTDITRERAVDVESLRDPAADVDRCSNPNWLVLIGVCTHLGCVPIAHSGDYGGYYCPCHGSHFDGAGRVRRGPAPRNLAIPPHRYLTETLLLVG